MSKPPPPPDFKKIFDTAWAALRKATSGSSSSQPGSGSTSTPPRMIAGPLIGLSLLGIGAYTAYHSMFFVQGGHRAVKFNAILGLFDHTYGEGAHFSIPYIETPIFYDIRSKPTEVTTSTGSRDLQLVNMSVRVLYRPNLNNLHHLYRNLGVKYADTVLPSIINEVIKSVVAQYNASELLTRRPEVSKQIAAHLTTRAQSFFIDISDVSITNMTFGKEYTAAIEAKQIAQQMAERAKFLVDQAQQEKRGAIVLAEGEAESARLVGEAIRSQPGFLEMRRLEAARAIAKAISNNNNNSQTKFVLDSEILFSATPKK